MRAIVVGAHDPTNLAALCGVWGRDCDADPLAWAMTGFEVCDRTWRGPAHLAEHATLHVMALSDLGNETCGSKIWSHRIGRFFSRFTVLTCGKSITIGQSDTAQGAFLSPTVIVDWSTNGGDG